MNHFLPNLPKTYYSFLFFALLFTQLSFGQRTRADLIFKDGTVLTGFAEPTTVHNIRFRKERKAKKQFFSFDEVDTLKVHYDFDPTIYVAVKIKDRSAPIVLEFVHKGKNVAYFRDNKQGYVAPMSFPNGGGAPGFQGGHSYNITHSYLRKTGSDEAIHLGSSDWMSKNFKKAASNFFSDCPKLVEKLQSREYRKRDLKEVIDFYNSECE